VVLFCLNTTSIWYYKSFDGTMKFASYVHEKKVSLFRVRAYIPTLLSTGAKHFRSTKFSKTDYKTSAGYTIVLILLGPIFLPKILFMMDFCLCGAILKLKEFCFGAIPDIMIELNACVGLPGLPPSGPKKGPHNLTSTGHHLSLIRQWIKHLKTKMYLKSVNAIFKQDQRRFLTWVGAPRHW
jgi:uncharacterized membrane protein required for colicin V production